MPPEILHGPTIGAWARAVGVEPCTPSAFAWGRAMRSRRAEVQAALIGIYIGVGKGRRLGAIAAELRRLADDLDGVDPWRVAA